MSPIPVGSRSVTGAFRAQPPVRGWFEFVVSAKPCSNPRADRPGENSGTLGRHVDPTQRIVVRASILISEAELVRINVV